MWETGLFALIVVAIATGWALGRYGRDFWRLSAARSSRNRSSAGNPGFFRGLDYLLNDKPDEAVEVFIQSLDISRETLDLHLALGNMLRRKGEVDRGAKLSRPVAAVRPRTQGSGEIFHGK